MSFKVASRRASTKEPVVMKDPEMEMRVIRLEDEFKKLALHL